MRLMRLHGMSVTHGSAIVQMVPGFYEVLEAGIQVQP